MAKKKNKKKKTPRSEQPIVQKTAKAKIPVQKKIPESLKPATSQNHKLIGWLLFILAIGLYANTYSHGYAFDDSIVIKGNSFTKQGLEGIPDLMTRDFFEGLYGDGGMDLSGGRYRPLSLVTFAIEYEFFGEAPHVGHAINIFLYGLTALLLYHVLLMLMASFSFGSIAALITSLIFITHPTHTEVVANIKSRDEILALLLLLGSIYSIYKVLKTETQSSTKWVILGSFSFFLAMLSKEHSFTFIVLFPLAIHAFNLVPEEGKQQEWSVIAKTCMPYWIAAVLYIMLRTAMVGGIEAETNPDIMENPFIGASFMQQYATIGVILLHYVLLLIFPHPLSCDYSFNQIPWTTFSDPVALLGAGLYIVMGIYAVMRLFKRDIPAYAILLYFIPLSLTTNILFNVGAPMADRFLYIPSLGFALALGYGVASWFKITSLDQLKSNLLVLGGLVVVVGAFSFKTITRNPDWKNNATLFAQDVKAVPNSAKIHYYYANSLLQKYMAEPNLQDPTKVALLQEAEKEFLRSHEINPQFHHATYNLGLVHVQFQNGQKALEWLNKTLAMQPQHILSHQLLGQVYGRFLQQPDKAIFHLKEAIEKGGANTPENNQSLGIVYAMQNDFGNAEKYFLEAIRLGPNNPKIRVNLGVLYMNNNKPNKAKAAFDAAKQIDPNIQVPQIPQ
ncbi:MAG: tetratricopeptide repeat protein [Aureispira sp.]|nr:tetratricopeptide repeat protein [Aureispira sp.]